MTFSDLKLPFLLDLGFTAAAAVSEFPVGLLGVTMTVGPDVLLTLTSSFELMVTFHSPESLLPLHELELASSPDVLILDSSASLHLGDFFLSGGLSALPGPTPVPVGISDAESIDGSGGGDGGGALLLPADAPARDLGGRTPAAATAAPKTVLATASTATRTTPGCCCSGCCC